MFSGALRIGAVRGIDIKIHASWIAIALLVGWTFTARFGSAVQGSLVLTITLAVVATVLFFASVLAHELAHSLEAVSRGVTVSGITLFLFGGVTETRFDVRRPRDEFALTAVGPFTSIVLAAFFGLVAAYADAAGLLLVGLVAGELGWINLALGIFNLLPGAPLDGGRILRSAVWWVTGDRDRAIRVAGRAGQLLGGGLALLGLLQAFFVPQAVLSGVWLAFIGWFLFTAAGQELTQQEARSLLAGRTIEELVERPPDLEPGASAEEAARMLTASPHDAVVTRGDGRVGIVEVDDVAGVAAEQRPVTPAAELATPLDELPVARAGEAVVDVLERLGGAETIVVLDSAGRFVGLATERQLVRMLERAAKLNRPPRKRRAPAGTPRRTRLPGEGA